MERNFTCILCPMGCTLTVDKNLNVTGHSCKRGEKYAIDEITNPLRTVTATVRVLNRKDTMLPVKTEKPVPKGKMNEVMAILRKIKVEAPVYLGDEILSDIFGTRIIATKTIE